MLLGLSTMGMRRGGMARGVKPAVGSGEALSFLCHKYCVRVVMGFLENATRGGWKSNTPVLFFGAEATIHFATIYPMLTCLEN